MGNEQKGHNLNQLVVNFMTYVSFVYLLVETGRKLWEAPLAEMQSGMIRIFTILFLGVASAIVYGVLWRSAEKFFGWHFGAGGYDDLPKGWEAVILSLTLTIPLIGVPMTYQHLMKYKIILPGHLMAGAVMLITDAVSHLILYGTKNKKVRFRGLKNIIFPLNSPLKPGRAIFMEVVFTFFHFGSIVIPYRLLTGSVVLSSNTLLSPALFLAGLLVFICILYPASLIDKTWVQVRGFFAGLILCITLEGGMLM